MRVLVDRDREKIGRHSRAVSAKCSTHHASRARMPAGRPLAVELAGAAVPFERGGVSMVEAGGKALIAWGGWVW
jgi:hypothetical protein